MTIISEQGENDHDDLAGWRRRLMSRVEKQTELNYQDGKIVWSKLVNLKKGMVEFYQTKQEGINKEGGFFLNEQAEK